MDVPLAQHDGSFSQDKLFPSDPRPLTSSCGVSLASPGQALLGWALLNPASGHPGPAGCWLFFLELSKEFGCKRFILNFYLGSMFLRIFYTLCSAW